ncbi:20090_t:CDS:2 [Entrophospora sp. SA101]|nr:20090_t:CDS:2 [Entrophospora sp. SA101]
MEALKIRYEYLNNNNRNLRIPNMVGGPLIMTRRLDPSIQ